MQKPSTMVFKAGTWKGDTYSNEDLKGTVGSYNRTVVEAPWVVGHAISAGDPAAGWIRSLVYQEDAQGVGEIWAKSDFNSLGKTILEGNTHQNKSISFYPKGSTASPDPTVFFPRHVALLGAEMPALHNLGAIGTCDFSASEASEGLLTYSCGCGGTIDDDGDKPSKTIKLSMSEFEMIMKRLDSLESKATSKKEEPEYSGALVQEAVESIETVEEDPQEFAAAAVDYESLYNSTLSELQELKQQSSSVSLAQVVDSYYSDGLIDPALISSKDLSMCLTKLSLGHNNFSDSEKPDVIIGSLIQSLKSAKPNLNITLGEETESLPPEFAATDWSTISTEGSLGDAFADQAEKIAAKNCLSFSQAMSALLSAKNFASETGESIDSALDREVNRFKVN